MSKILFWGGFGIAVRVWQLGIEMRPILQRNALWAYPLFGGIGASFGYWLQGVEERQLRMLAETRDSLLEKRRRRAEREGQPNIGSHMQRNEDGLFATPKLFKDTGIETDAPARH